ncbi:hypothetical protein jaqu_38680 [Jannaschia aquimarina]|uniref:Uncharacterized protein n=1 Tax=Jannaschia aquimarina TaxID=935700 RepID=A0A0D1CIL4_9RHOB|nr:hypothetical protein jaqu_38680 [Jannaschia aquimarina]SNT34969.1 hypothetical protein SAMN05421775_11284 [Jannaschia aquimarina]
MAFDLIERPRTVLRLLEQKDTPVIVGLFADG